MSGDIPMDQKHVLNDRIVEIVRRYARDLNKVGIPFDELIVFGSQAKGTAKEWSDIDVCVVSRHFGDDRFDEQVKLMVARDDDVLDIEPHPYNPKDLADKYDPLASEIRKYGIQVV